MINTAYLPRRGVSHNDDYIYKMPPWLPPALTTTSQSNFKEGWGKCVSPSTKRQPTKEQKP